MTAAEQQRCHGQQRVESGHAQQHEPGQVPSQHLTIARVEEAGGEAERDAGAEQQPAGVRDPVALLGTQLADERLDREQAEEQRACQDGAGKPGMRGQIERSQREDGGAPDRQQQPRPPVAPEQGQPGAGDHEGEQRSRAGDVLRDQRRCQHRGDDAEDGQRLLLDPDRQGDSERRDRGGTGQAQRLGDEVVHRDRSPQRGVEAGDAGAAGGQDRVGAPAAPVELEGGSQQPQRDQHAQPHPHLGGDPSAAGGQHEQQSDAKGGGDAAGPGQGARGECLLRQLRPVDGLALRSRRDRRARRGGRRRQRVLGATGAGAAG